jgi:hypothetical protein
MKFSAITQENRRERKVAKGLVLFVMAVTLIALAAYHLQPAPASYSFAQDRISNWGFNHSSSLIVYKDTLYGILGHAVFAFDGSTWSRVFGYDDEDIVGFGRIVWMDKLYFAGATKKGATVWSYDGSTWREVFVVTDLDVANEFFSLSSYNDCLFVGGFNNRYRGVVYASCDGNEFHLLKMFDNYENRNVRSMAVFGEALYLGGGGATSVWKFDGTSFVPELSGVTGEINVLVVYNGSILAGGGIWTAGQGYLFASKDGHLWIPIFVGGTVYDATVFNGLLFFVTADENFGHCLASRQYDACTGSVYVYDGNRVARTYLVHEGLQSIVLYRRSLYFASAGYGFVFKGQIRSTSDALYEVPGRHPEIRTRSTTNALCMQFILRRITNLSTVV